MNKSSLRITLTLGTALSSLLVHAQQPIVGIDDEVTTGRPLAPGVFYSSDPMARKRQAQAIRARSPQALEEQGQAQLRLAERRLYRGITLQPVYSELDDLGTRHTRFRELFNGVPVKDGGLVSHRLPDWTYEKDSNFLMTNIDLSTTPRVDLDRALQSIANLDSHRTPYAWPPSGELMIYPRYQRSSVRLDDYNPADPNAFQPYNADRTPRTIAGYNLVWKITTLEGVEGTPGPTNNLVSVVDAITGDILSQESADPNEDVDGHGFWAGDVKVASSLDQGSNRYSLEDPYRIFHTRDEDYGSDDFSNVLIPGHFWGNGLQFPLDGGDGHSASWRQTALVDIHFFAMVNWDMFSFVFNRNGMDFNYYSVNNFAHSDTSWQNAKYYSLSGNIAYGDGGPYQAIEVVGHEHGHSFQDWTNGLGGDVDEGLADQWGTLTRIFLLSGSWKNQSYKFPDTWPANTDGAYDQYNNVWINSVGRDMIKPSRNNDPDAYYPGIDNMEIHARGGPSNRAFYFLVQGASSHMERPDATPWLSWGMAGVGPHTAARILYSAMAYYLPSGPDYNQLRAGMVSSAKHRFGAHSPQAAAVRNAFAGINVGSVDSSYWASPKMISTAANNKTPQTAQLLAAPNTSLSKKPPLSPDKLSVLVQTTGPRYFAIDIPAGLPYTVRLRPVTTPVNGSTKIILRTGEVNNGNGVDTAQLGQRYALISGVTLPGSGSGPVQKRHVNIGTEPQSSGAFTYILDIDFP